MHRHVVLAAFNFDTRYRLYENLTLLPETGWAKLDLADITSGSGRSDLANSSAWKAAFAFLNRFQDEIIAGARPGSPRRRTEIPYLVRDGSF